MRYREITLQESPIGSIDYYGPTTPQSMRADDIKAVNNPKWRVNTKRILDKAPILINLAFVNHDNEYVSQKYGPENKHADPNRSFQKPDGGHIHASGIMTKEQVKIAFGIDIDADKNALTILYAFNEGDNRVPFTPWMVAHRMGHALEERRGRNEEFSFLYGDLEDIVGKVSYWVKLCDKPYAINFWGLNLADIAPIIGTFKSAREGHVIRGGEFVLECFAQWLISGKIKLNKLPREFDIKRSEGTASQEFHIKFKSEQYNKIFNDRIESWREGAEERFSNALKACVGKIIVL